MKKLFNRALAAEKKLFALFLPCLLILTSCDGKNTPDVKDAHEVIGHSYTYTQDVSNYVTFYFSTTGQMKVTSCQSGTKNEYTHFTYVISNCLIEVYRDNSSYWSVSMQGGLAMSLTYNPEKDNITWQDGNSVVILSRTN